MMLSIKKEKVDFSWGYSFKRLIRYYFEETIGLDVKVSFEGA